MFRAVQLEDVPEHDPDDRDREDVRDEQQRPVRLPPPHAIEQERSDQGSEHDQDRDAQEELHVVQQRAQNSESSKTYR